MYVNVSELVGTVAGATASMFLIATAARVYLRRLEFKARAPQLTPGLEQRLERIEQAVDTIAVEVERVSEAVRFTTRLLADRKEPSALPSAGERR